MRVDFYQLSQSSIEEALPALAGKVLEGGDRLVVVSGDEAQLARIGTGLWSVKDRFLAHAAVGGPHDARQPILLADDIDAPNGARFAALADGIWRDRADQFARVFLFFDTANIEQARATWRRLGEREGLERNYWRQLPGNKWENVA